MKFYELVPETVALFVVGLTTMLLLFGLLLSIIEKEMHGED